MHYQAMGRVKGTEEWESIKYGELEFYADEAGLNQLHQMTAMLAQVHRNKEYMIREVDFSK